MFTLLKWVLLFDSVLLIAAILLQAGQGGGLASLGGGGGTDVFMGGRQAVTLLTKLTWYCAAVFLLIALTLAIMSSQSRAPQSVLQGNLPAPSPVQSVPLPLQTTPQPATPASPKPNP
jgi:preprotein translocase subunit SecG